MDGELWKQVYRVVMQVGATFRSPCVQFSDAAIVLTFLWASLHGRCMSWGCRSENWPPPERWWPHPSPATMSRRLRTPAVARFLDEVLRRCNLRLPRGGLRYIDGKPLPIGGASGDPDAGFGRAAGSTMAKGYKLHVIWDSGGAVEAWEVHPMNVQEKVIARPMIAKLDDAGFLVGDNNYDSNRLFDLAADHAHQLLTPKRRGVKNLGHCRQSLHRLRCLRMLDDGVGRPLLKARFGIERHFGSLGNFAGGLGPLPNFVRRLPRVRRWVQSKLIFNAIRIAKNKGLAA